MYDITKTRMLLTTAVFAAVAAVFAGGANARALAEDGSSIGAEPVAPVAAVAATVDPLAESWLIGQGLSLDEVKSWTAGACSQEVKAASCYAMFERTSPNVSQFSRQASSRLAGLLRAAQTRDRESGALSG
jgi:hypothetical protein